MREPDEIPRWYFVDESGDTAFYARRSKRIIVGEEGCSRVFILGFIRTRDPQSIRNKLAEIRAMIAGDRYLEDIPSVKKSLVYFHAKDDCPEVRKLVFEAIVEMSFGAQVVVIRKDEQAFRRHYRRSEMRFYDNTVTTLFLGQLHRSNRNHVVFAKRGNKLREHALRAAVNKSVREYLKENDAHQVDILGSCPTDEAALQVIDYVNWAVYRAYERGEMRYFDFIRSKVEVLRDSYDTAKKKRGESCAYDRSENPFDIKKASPLS